MSAPAPRSFIWRLFRGIAALFVGLLLLLVGLFLVVDYWMEAQRAEWKTATLAHLAEAELRDPFVQSELRSLTSDPANTPIGSWAGQKVIKMTNGEHLVYDFRHGANIGYLDHLFLARGSNGRWYYSTYHFCNMLTGIRMDNPPSSISDFASKYWLREFDGKSDICLESTAPE